MHLAGTITKLTSQRNDLGNDQLGDAARVTKWRIEDRNAMVGSILEVDLVCSDAEAADGDKVPCLFQHTRGQFRL